MFAPIKKKEEKVTNYFIPNTAIIILTLQRKLVRVCPKLDSGTNVKHKIILVSYD